MAARKLSMKVIELCTVKLEPGIKQFLVSALSGDSSYLKTQIEYHEVIYDLYQCAPKILHSIIPYLTGELLVNTHIASYLLHYLISRFTEEVPILYHYCASSFSESTTGLCNLKAIVPFRYVDHFPAYLFDLFDPCEE